MHAGPKTRPACCAALQAFDILTPLGRGQAQQIVGPQGSGKTQVGLHPASKDGLGRTPPRPFSS